MAEPTLDGPGMIYVTSKIVRSDILDDTTYLRWYEEKYIPDILEKTPIKSAFRFANANAKADLAYLLICPIAELAAIHGEGSEMPTLKSLLERHGGGPIRSADVDVRGYELIQRYDPHGRSEGTVKFLATGGFELGTITEQELHDWYDQEHLQRISEVPGYLRTTRYRLVYHSTSAGAKGMGEGGAQGEEKEKEKDNPPTWLAIHEFDDGFNMDALRGTIDTEWTRKIFSGTTKQEYGVYRHVRSYGEGKFFH